MTIFILYIFFVSVDRASYAKWNRCLDIFCFKINTERYISFIHTSLMNYQYKILSKVLYCAVLFWIFVERI